MNPAEYGIYAHNVSHHYAQRTIIDNLDFELKPGEFFGFLGRNGAGKSTAIRALCGFLQPTAGEIWVAGVNVRQDPVEVRRHIGVLSEDVAVYERLTGQEFLEFAGQMHGLSPAEAGSRTADLLERLELSGAAHRAITGYSLGMKKKIAFAAALIHAPRVLFLDEPFNGVDAASARLLGDLLQNLASDQGVTIFFTSHVFEQAERLCTRIAVLQEGSIRHQGTVGEWRAEAVRQGQTLEAFFLQLTGVDTSPPSPLTWYT